MNPKEKKAMYKGIEDYAAYLKMPAMKKYYQEEIKEANLKDVSYEEFLYKLLQKEADLRLENAKQNRIRRANFPYKKYLEDLIIEDLPEDARKKLKILT
jgi:DNA replication protein DnaC